MTIQTIKNWCSDQYDAAQDLYEGILKEGYVQELVQEVGCSAAASFALSFIVTIGNPVAGITGAAVGVVATLVHKCLMPFFKKIFPPAPDETMNFYTYKLICCPLSLGVTQGLFKLLFPQITLNVVVIACAILGIEALSGAWGKPVSLEKGTWLIVAV